MRKGMVSGFLALVVLAGCATAPRGTVVSVPGGSYRYISVLELSQMLKAKDFFLVNVHVPYQGELPGTDAFISYKDTTARLGDYPRDKSAMIVVYCMTNHMSGIAAGDLVAAGYTNVYLVDGGMKAWRKAGYTLKDRTVTD
ncbi:MAG: rhodanese-like domain-containing protein [Spirochaetia bacterium]|jgi:rhodanese-related sulfurtransferase